MIRRIKMIKGIDVSRFQGVIDWQKVKADGVGFAIIKAGGSDAGLYTDSAFERNYAGAKAAGLPVGAYYYVGRLCISRADGIADAERFIALLAGKQFEYPVYIDLEETETKNRAGATEAVIAFCETMEAAGYYCGIYASDISGFKDRLDISRLSAFDKWVANYISQPGYVDKYGIWQRASQGRVNGITGNVDIDECYQDYPAIIKANGLNGFSKPEQPKPQKKSIKITVEYDDHIYSGLLTED
jgi:GH25 family lysozyme M1 (1,4-beta-N-acetylmuramidase)